MGATYVTTCLECGEDAPEVGDFGYVGFPDLSRDRGIHSVPNFGYVYEGLMAVGLRTLAVEQMRQFLEGHSGHELMLFCEGEPVDDLEDGAPGVDSDEPTGSISGSGIRDWPPVPHRLDTDAFPASHYEIECSKCGDRFRTVARDHVLAFESAPLTSDDADRFLRSVDEDGAFDRGGEPFSMEDIDGIAAFFKGHGAHTPIVRALVY